MAPPSSSNPYNLPPLKDRLREVFNTYFKFGYTTFGGPAAHIAILYDEIVVKREWISNEQFTELFAICQALPGPASTELAYSLTLVRIPGAVVMTVVGVLIANIKEGIPVWATRLEQGLASAAIGLVALAAYRMSTTLATDKLTRILALVAGGASALYTAPWLLPVIMISGGLVSYTFDAFIAPAHLRWSEQRVKRKEKDVATKNDLEKGDGVEGAESTAAPVSNHTHDGSISDGNLVTVVDGKASSVHGSLRNRSTVEAPASAKGEDDAISESKIDNERKQFSYTKKLGFFFLLIFLAFLTASILVKALVPPSTVAEYGPLAATFFFVGSIIFGGGPVIIPLLKTYTVDSGWMTNQQFLVGLALIQSLPGPNFNFACFLGAVAMINANKNGVVGAVLCFIGIFLPGLLLKNAIIPFWQFVRQHPSVKMVFRGVNACALGLVFSATWLLWVQTNELGGHSGYHGVIASTAFVAAGYLDVPAPFTIILGGAMGAIEYAVSK
ncbi:hypothetical protein BGZ70_001217 [Mortierella alpina]|uniref:Chromate transporter n=1 Tax=Mortierella alpina TaxID=64518 RepID=A0A9P6JBW9_MORAP|nr:hypothetical protein BGZ70_001217 [Mortierella alpina]